MCKVSIIMPVYNAGRYVEEAINSIINQTFTDWELILINDGSNDNSGSICRSFADKRIRYIEHTSNLKLIETLNEGIDLCQGDYIARMDADDICHPERLQKQIFFLEKHSEYILVGSNATLIDDKGIKTGNIYNPTDNETLKISLLFTTPFVHPSVMFRAKILKGNKYSIKYPHSEDQELWIRLSALGKFANLKEELLSYRIHTTNVSVIYNENQKANYQKLLYSNLQKLNIKASTQELALQRLTFELYTAQTSRQQRFDELRKWFSTLVKANQNTLVYQDQKFQAFLWSRWTVYCFFYKKRIRALLPGFVYYSPKTIFHYLKLLLYLYKKK